MSLSRPMSKVSSISSTSTAASSALGGSPSRRRGQVGSHAGGGTSRSVHVGLGECSVDVEQEHLSDPSQMTLCSDFKQLCREDGLNEGLLHCLQTHGFVEPNRLQRHALPVLLHLLGRELGSLGDPGMCVGGARAAAGHRGTGCAVIQGPAGAGKTSAAFLALLSALDVSLARPQVVILVGSSKHDASKYLDMLKSMGSVTFQAFLQDEADGSGISEKSPQVRAACTAHVLLGRPRHILKLLSSVNSLHLDSMRCLIVDDVEELLHATPSETPTPGVPGQDAPTIASQQASGKVNHFDARCCALQPSPPFEPRSPLSGPMARPRPRGPSSGWGSFPAPATSPASATATGAWDADTALVPAPPSSPPTGRRRPMGAAGVVAAQVAGGKNCPHSTDLSTPGHPLQQCGFAGAAGTWQAPTPTMAAPALSSTMEDIVKIRNILECRQYMLNLSDTYTVRSGQVPVNKIRYLILSRPIEDTTSRKVFRLFKNSLMKKKTVPDDGHSAMPWRTIREMKHYFHEAPRSEWVQIFAGLVRSLMFPRALIFCDAGDTEIFGLFRQMQSMGLPVGLNAEDTGAAAASRDFPGVAERDSRQKAVQAFIAGKTQFLLTRSDPTLCQVVLPKVSCVFHFGIPCQEEAIYGTRLQTLDAQVARDATSILLLDVTPSVLGDNFGELGSNLARSVGRLFEVRLEPLPTEVLQPALGSHDICGG